MTECRKRVGETLLVVGLSACYVSLGQPVPLVFQKPVHLSSGSLPQTVLIADVNHDGNNDILIANGNNKLSVYLGDGKGHFVAAKGSPFKAGPSPNDLAIGDFNGDNNPDVAIANHGEKLVTILSGDGKGGFSFAPGSPFTVPSNPHPHGIAAADFNGDGIVDLAVDSWGENRVLVMVGNGDGTFRRPGTKFIVGEAPYQRLRAADLNGDGHPDLITSNWEGSSVSVLLGDGKGNFRLAGGKNIPVPASPFGVAIGDFNGDRRLDIAVCHYSGHGPDRSKNGLSVLYGNGAGEFTLANGSPFAIGHYPASIVAGDINGDGITDIAIPNHEDNTVTIYLGGTNGIRQATGSPFPAGRGPKCVAIGDLNGDSKPDLVVSNEQDDDIIILSGK
jgi:hypothetical protein